MIEGRRIFSESPDENLPEEIESWLSIRIEVLSKEVMNLQEQVNEKEKLQSKQNEDIQGAYTKYIGMVSDECEARIRAIENSAKASYLEKRISKANGSIREVKDIQQSATEGFSSIESISKDVGVMLSKFQGQVTTMRTNYQKKLEAIGSRAELSAEKSLKLKLKTEREDRDFKMKEKLNADIMKLNSKIEKRTKVLEIFKEEKKEIEKRITSLEDASSFISKCIAEAQSNNPEPKFSFSNFEVADIQPARRKPPAAFGNLMVLAPIGSLRKPIDGNFFPSTFTL